MKFAQPTHTFSSAPGVAASFWKFIISALFACWLIGAGGCARPEPTLVVFVGGLGVSQLGDLRRAVEKEFPEAKVVNAGGWDGYKANITGIVNDKPRERVILVGHSLGAPAISEAASKLPKVDLAVFIDPAWDDFKLPKNVDQHLWYKRSDFSVVREAKVLGANEAKTIKGGHNDIPHSQELIADVVGKIRGIEVQAAKAKDAEKQRALAQAHE
jgi:hypothetical protein